MILFFHNSSTPGKLRPEKHKLKTSLGSIALKQNAHCLFFPLFLEAEDRCFEQMHALALVFYPISGQRWKEWNEAVLKCMLAQSTWKLMLLSFLWLFMKGNPFLRMSLGHLVSECFTMCSLLLLFTASVGAIHIMIGINYQLVLRDSFTLGHPLPLRSIKT